MGSLIAVALLVGALAQRPVDSPHVTRVVAVGPAPSAMALDNGTGRAFVADSIEGSVRVLEVGAGTVARTLALGNAGPVAVSERTGRVFVAGAWNGPDRYGVYDDHATVYVLDGRTATLLRTIALSGTDSATAMAVDDAPRGRQSAGRVYVVFPGAVYVLDARTGATIRTLAVRRGPGLIALDARRGRAFIVADESMTVVDTRTATVLRTVRVGVRPSALAVDERTGHVFVAAENAVLMLDARDGTLLHTSAVRRLSGALAVDAPDGRAVVTNAEAGTVSLLDTRTGAIIRTIQVSGMPVAAAVDERTGHAFIGSQGPYTRREPLGWGTVLVLDARDGARLNTVPVGDVTALAVDARTGRVLVVNREDRSGGQTDTWAWLPAWMRDRVRWLPRPAPPRASTSGTVNIIDATR